MNRIWTCIAVSIVVMLIMPWLTAEFVADHAAMAAVLLFFAVNPVCSIWEGIAAGRNVRSMWWLPVCNAALFLAGAWLAFDMGTPDFLVYAVPYLMLGIVSMLISWKWHMRRDAQMCRRPASH